MIFEAGEPPTPGPSGTLNGFMGRSKDRQLPRGCMRLRSAIFPRNNATGIAAQQMGMRCNTRHNLWIRVALFLGRKDARYQMREGGVISVQGSPYWSYTMNIRSLYIILGGGSARRSGCNTEDLLPCG